MQTNAFIVVRKLMVEITTIDLLGRLRIFHQYLIVSIQNWLSTKNLLNVPIVNRYTPFSVTRNSILTTNGVAPALGKQKIVRCKTFNALHIGPTPQHALQQSASCCGYPPCSSAIIGRLLQCIWSHIHHIYIAAAFQWLGCCMVDSHSPSCLPIQSKVFVVAHG